MKQALLIVFLGLVLLSLTACASKSPRSENNAELGEKSAKVSLSDGESGEPLLLQDGSYGLEAEKSRLAWRGEKVIGKNHTGTVSVQSGELQVRDNKLIGGEFVIDLKSLKSDEGIEGLEKHLKSADFFDVDLYPTAKLAITGAEAGEDGFYKISADLTIKDVTAPVNFEAKLSPTAEGLSASAQFEIDRTVWGLKYGSGKFFQDLGDNMINDDIIFDVDLQANRKN